MDKQPGNQGAWNAHISLDAVRVTPAGIQTTRYAFVIVATGKTPNGPWSSLDYARAYLEAAGWKCSEIEVTTWESSTAKATEPTLLPTLDKNTGVCVNCGQGVKREGLSSTDSTDWALQHCS
jgi:hypothetical protein